MKIVICFFLMIFIPVSMLVSQPIDTLWTRTLSAAPYADLVSYEMIKYSSNEFIVAGGRGDSLYVVKLNSNGNIIWEKYMYSAGGLFGTALDKDPSGNFYVIVWNYNLSNQWKLIKFNPSGDSLWSRTINDPGSSFHIPYGITVNSDYVYVAASAGNGPEKFALHKFNLDSDLLYSRTYSTGSNFSIPRSVTYDSDGNIILAGTGGTGGGWYILKCNSNGDTLWSKSLYGFGQEARNVITDNDNNIIVTGWTNKIIKYDPDGNLLFSKTLEGDDNWEGASLLRYDDENVFVVGAKRRGIGSWSFDILLGKYSTNTGDSMWTYVYYYPEPQAGAYGWDGAVFFDNSLVVLSGAYTEVSGNYFQILYLMNFSLADTPVPVELESFTANVTDEGNVVLKWSTATEINNQMFEIERKQENSEYLTIGYVNGHGTTTEQKDYSFVDQRVGNGQYYYRLKQIDYDGTYRYTTEVFAEVNGLLTFELKQNYPNPFNPSTKIAYSVTESGNIKLAVYNVVGEEVAVLVNGQKEAGFYETTFDASNLPSGMYLYKLQTDNSVEVKKMILLR